MADIRELNQIDTFVRALLANGPARARVLGVLRQPGGVGERASELRGMLRGNREVGLPRLSSAAAHDLVVAFDQITARNPGIVDVWAGELEPISIPASLSPAVFFS
jgi:hypothetical protein